MNGKIGGILGSATVAVLVILCCAGPPLALALVSLGIGTWLTAHGLWLLGVLGFLIAVGAGLVVYRRRRAADGCTVDERGTGKDGATGR